MVYTNMICMIPPGDSRSLWPGSPATQVVELPLLGPSLRPRPPYLPPALPADLATRITRWVAVEAVPRSVYRVQAARGPRGVVGGTGPAVRVAPPAPPRHQAAGRPRHPPPGPGPPHRGGAHQVRAILLQISSTYLLLLLPPGGRTRWARRRPSTRWRSTWRPCSSGSARGS